MKSMFDERQMQRTIHTINNGSQQATQIVFKPTEYVRSDFYTKHLTLLLTRTNTSVDDDTLFTLSLYFRVVRLFHCCDDAIDIETYSFRRSEGF